MKSSKFISFLLILVVLVLVGVYFFQSNSDTEEVEMPQVSVVESGAYQVQPTQSQIGWFGEKKLVPASHTGSVAVAEGALSVGEAGVLEDGYVVIDMTTLAVEEGDMGGQQVLDHLASDDFFSVATYPTARLDISGSELTEAGLVVDGALTIKETTQPVNFVAVPTIQDDGSIAFAGELMFDRSLYDVRFGSESFFNDLGDAIIKDDVVITFNLVAVPEA